MTGKNTDREIAALEHRVAGLERGLTELGQRAIEVLLQQRRAGGQMPEPEAVQAMSESNVEKAAEVIRQHGDVLYDTCGCGQAMDPADQPAHIAEALAGLLMPDGATEEDEWGISLCGEVHRDEMTEAGARGFIADWVEDGGKPGVFSLIRRCFWVTPWEEVTDG